MTPDECEMVYSQFVVENYYGGVSEPITPEYFKERWEEMSEVDKTALTDRARRGKKDT